MSFSPSSPWLADSQAEYPSLAKNLLVDFALIGGGISGVSLAYWLKKIGGASVSVAVLESGLLSGGATGRNAGLILPGLSENLNRTAESIGTRAAHELWDSSVQNEVLVRTTAEAEGIECEYRRNGSYRATVFPREVEEFHASHEWLLREGFASEMVDEATLNRTLGSEEFLAGQFFPGAAAYNPVKFVRGLALAAAREGVRFFEGTTVEAITFTPEGRPMAKCPGGTVTAERLAVCTNSAAVQLRPRFAGFLRPVRAQMLQVSPIPPDICFECGVYVNFGYDYFAQAADGSLLAGGKRYMALNAEETAIAEPSEFLQEHIHAFLLKHYPVLKGALVIRRWAGIMAHTADGLPVVGKLPGDQEVFCLVGWNGHGNGFACRTARDLARVMIDGGHPKFPALFSPWSAHRKSVFLEG